MLSFGKKLKLFEGNIPEAVRSEQSPCSSEAAKSILPSGSESNQSLQRDNSTCYLLGVQELKSKIQKQTPMSNGHLYISGFLPLYSILPFNEMTRSGPAITTSLLFPSKLG
jgi:hypothetical protein